MVILDGDAPSFTIIGVNHFKSGNKKEPGLNNPGSFHLVSKRGHQIYFTNNLNSAPTHHYFYRSQIVVMESSNSSAV